MIKKYLLSLMLIPVALVFIPVFASETTTEVILQPVQKNTPSFKRTSDYELGVQYPIRLVKIHNDLQIVQPPDIKANVLYYGVVKLGVPAVEYGVLIDLEGKDKNLWVDADADGDFTKESPYQLFKSDRYTGVNVYYSPLPLVFNVKYDFADHIYQTQLSFDLPYLAIAQTGFKDYFYLRARTWFTGIIETEGASLQFAIVDTNDNGFYNDSDDLIFFDTDYDLNYSEKEAKQIKTQKTISLKAGKNFKIDYQYCPEKLILTKG